MSTTRDDQVWNKLLAQSAPTFSGPDAPPFGLATRVLAQVRHTEMQGALWERVGRRAVYAALGAVIVTALLTFARVQVQDEVEAPLHSLTQADDAPAS